LGPTFPTAEDSMTTEYTARLRAIVATHGFAIQHVAADQHTFGFAYTVGLSADGQGRELFAINLPPQLSQSLLNTLAQRLKGMTALPDQVTDLASVAMRLREVPTATLGVPLAVYSLVDIPVPPTVVQLIWPCAAGHWPGEIGYTHACPQDPTNLSIPPFH